MRLLVWLMLLIVCLGGCTASQRVVSRGSGSNISTSIRTGFDKGDWVVVEVTSGETYTGKLIEIGYNSIGIQQRDYYALAPRLDIPHDNIVAMEKQEFSLLKTFVGIAGTIFILFLLVVESMKDVYIGY